MQVKSFNQKVRSSMKRPDVKPGDIVKIHRKIKEGAKERIQIFEGIVISEKGGQSSSPMITVRRVAHGSGIEITIPVYSPVISKIEIVRSAKVRRSKLYYLRRGNLKISKLKTKELAPFAAKEEKDPEPEKISDNIPAGENSTDASENKSEGAEEGNVAEIKADK